jgi:hypothetical protein
MVVLGEGGDSFEPGTPVPPTARSEPDRGGVDACVSPRVTAEGSLFVKELTHLGPNLVRVGWLVVRPTPNASSILCPAIGLLASSQLLFNLLSPRRADFC